MVVQFSGPDTLPGAAGNLQEALFGAGAMQAFILGIAALFVFQQLKHGVKKKRLSFARSRAKSWQSKVRSREAKLTRRSRARF